MITHLDILMNKACIQCRENKLVYRGLKLTQIGWSYIYLEMQREKIPNCTWNLWKFSFLTFRPVIFTIWSYQESPHKNLNQMD